MFLGLAQSLSLKDTIIPAVYFIRDVWIADRPEHRTLCRSTVCEVHTTIDVSLTNGYSPFPGGDPRL